MGFVSIEFIHLTHRLGGEKNDNGKFFVVSMVQSIHTHTFTLSRTRAAWELQNYMISHRLSCESSVGCQTDKTGEKSDIINNNLPIEKKTCSLTNEIMGILIVLSQQHYHF